jgi:hypothetical protein
MQIKYMRIQRLFREELWFSEVIYCWANLPFSGTYCQQLGRGSESPCILLVEIMHGINCLNMPLSSSTSDVEFGLKRRELGSDQRLGEAGYQRVDHDQK